MAEPTGGLDPQTIAAWGGGIGIFIAALYTALFRRGSSEEVEGRQPTFVDTKIVTADSVAMNVLASEISANTVATVENNSLQRELLTKVNDYLKQLAEDRQERQTNEEIKRLLREELAKERAEQAEHPTRQQRRPSG